MNPLAVKFITELIGCYRSFPCLWKMSNRDYFNRIMRAKAYDKMVEICLQYYPNADVNFAKMKIQNMRAVYKKEVRKVEMSKISGGGEIYVPRLWYYHLFTFLKYPNIIRSSEGLSEEEYEEDVLPDCSQLTEDLKVIVLDAMFDEAVNNYEDTMVDSSAARSPHVSAVQPVTSTVRSRKKIQKVVTKTDELLEQARQLLSNGLDEYEGIGINVAGKMRRMEERQRIYCEKLLTDLLTKGLLGELDANTVIGSSGHKSPPQTPCNQESLF